MRLELEKAKLTLGERVGGSGGGREERKKKAYESKEKFCETIYIEAEVEMLNSNLQSELIFRATLYTPKIFLGN